MRRDVDKRNPEQSTSINICEAWRGMRMPGSSTRLSTRRVLSKAHLKYKCWRIRRRGNAAPGEKNIERGASVNDEAADRRGGRLAEV